MRGLVDLDALSLLHAQNELCLDRVQRALSVLADQLDRVLRVATFVYDGQCHKEGSPSKACHAVHCNSFLWLLC